MGVVSLLCLYFLRNWEHCREGKTLLETAMERLGRLRSLLSRDHQSAPGPSSTSRSGRGSPASTRPRLFRTGRSTGKCKVKILILMVSCVNLKG